MLKISHCASSIEKTWIFTNMKGLCNFEWPPIDFYINANGTRYIFNNSLTDTFIVFTRGLPYHKIVNFKSFPSLAIRALEWPLISHVWKAKEIKMTLLLADFWSKQNNPVVIQIPDRMKATAHASLTKVRIQVLNLALEIGSDMHVLPFSNYSDLKKAWWKTKSL